LLAMVVQAPLGIRCPRVIVDVHREQARSYKDLVQPGRSVSRPTTPLKKIAQVQNSAQLF